jgi:hypothetical protein
MKIGPQEGEMLCFCVRKCMNTTRSHQSIAVWCLHQTRWPQTSSSFLMQNGFDNILLWLEHLPWPSRHSSFHQEWHQNIRNSISRCLSYKTCIFQTPFNQPDPKRGEEVRRMAVKHNNQPWLLELVLPLKSRQNDSLQHFARIINTAFKIVKVKQEMQQSATARGK